MVDDTRINMNAIPTVKCDLCNGGFHVEIVSEEPGPGEVTQDSETTVCPHCVERVPVRFFGQSLRCPSNASGSDS